MIATITLNPCLDRTITVDGLKVDEANRWITSRVYAGGKGIDVSRAIHEMGGITAAYGFIGGPAGRTLEILLDEEGVLFSFTPISQETRVNFIITDTKTSQQTRIDSPGPHISKRELERFYKKMRQIYPRPDLLMVGGSVPPGIPNNIYYDIISEARGYGVRTLLDSDRRWLKEGIKAKPYLIKPNVHEAEELLKTKLATEEAIVKAALGFVEMGVEIAVISRGKDGIIAATKDEIVKAVPPTVKVRSLIGAGDCTIAGLALKLANEESLVEACRLGVAMGTAAVLRPGAQLSHKADVERLLPRIKVERIKTGKRTKAFFSAGS
jgi:6-phosphofructokinase 2